MNDEIVEEQYKQYAESLKNDSEYKAYKKAIKNRRAKREFMRQKLDKADS